MRRFARIFGAVLVVATALPAIAQVTDDDIDEARAEVNRIVAESQELGDAVQEAWARQHDLDHEIGDLTASIELARVQVGVLETRVEEVAVELAVQLGEVLVSAQDVPLNVFPAAVEEVPAADAAREGGLQF